MAGPTQKELEVLVSELEVRTERLRKLYDQYFLGFEKLEPTVARKDVDRRLEVIRKEQLRNTALRFRFQMITQKYSTYQTLWARTCRAIEEGTFKRHLAKARARFGKPGEQPEADIAIDVDLEDFDDLEAQVAADMSALESGEASEAAADDVTSAGAAPVAAMLDGADGPPTGSSWRPAIDGPAPVVNIPAPAPRAFNPAVQRADASPASRRIVRRPPPVDPRPAEPPVEDPPQPAAPLDLSDPFESTHPRERTPAPVPSPARGTQAARPMIRPRAPGPAPEPTPPPREVAPLRREDRIVRRPPPMEARREESPRPAPVEAAPSPPPAPVRREERIVRPPPPVEPPKESTPTRREERIVRPPPPVEARPSPERRQDRIVRPPPPADAPPAKPDAPPPEPAKVAPAPPPSAPGPARVAAPPPRVPASPQKPIKPVPLPSSLRAAPRPLGHDPSGKKDGDPA